MHQREYFLENLAGKRAYKESSIAVRRVVIPIDAREIVFPLVEVDQVFDFRRCFLSKPFRETVILQTGSHLVFKEEELREEDPRVTHVETVQKCDHLSFECLKLLDGNKLLEVVEDRFNRATC